MALQCPVACRDIDRSDQRKQCTDVHPKCSDWAKEGECDDEKDVKHFCAKSCDHCLVYRKLVEDESSSVDSSSSSCVDSNDTCNFWAEAGECQSNPTVSIYCLDRQTDR
jgi:hypothetical protein